MYLAKLFSSIILVLLLSTVASAQQQVGPMHTFRGELTECFIEGLAYKIADDTTNQGKEYCCNSNVWVLCPTADTSLELATELSDETGTEGAVFATEATMRNLTVNLLDGSSNNVLQCFDEDEALSFDVDNLGMINLGNPTASPARLNIQNAGASIRAIEPDAFSYGTPLIWFVGDDITGGTEGLGGCGVSSSTGCIVPDRGSGPSNFFTDGKINGDNGGIWRENVMNGHNIIEQGASTMDIALAGSGSIDAEYIISSSFTMVMVYDPNTFAGNNTIVSGGGAGQPGDSDIKFPCADTSDATFEFRDDGGEEEEWGHISGIADAPIIAIMRRNGTSALSASATINNTLTTFGTATELGNITFNAMFERNGGGSDAAAGVQLAEWIVYADYLSNNEVDQLYQHLAGKYGLTLLPAGGGLGGPGSSGGELIAAYNASGTQIFTLDASGDVGIGTTSPDAALEVELLTEQLRLAYTSGNSCSWTVDSGGDLTIDCTGNNVTFADSVSFSGFPVSGCYGSSQNNEFGLVTGIDSSGNVTCFDWDTLLDTAVAGSLVFLGIDETPNRFEADSQIRTGGDNILIEGSSSATFLDMACNDASDLECHVRMTGGTNKDLHINSDNGDLVLEALCSGVCGDSTVRAVTNDFYIGKGGADDVILRFDNNIAGDATISFDYGEQIFIFSDNFRIFGQQATSATGEFGVNEDFWATGRDAAEFFDGTERTTIVATLQSDTATAGQVPMFNSDGTMTWESALASAGNSYSQSFTTQTSISLTHGLGTDNLLIACYDTGDIQLEPSRIDIGAASPFAVAITFSESISGRCVVNGLNANYSQSFTSQTSVTLTHNLGTNNLITMCYDASDIWVSPSRIDIAANAPWSVVTTFSESFTGRCVVNGITSGRYVASFTSQTTVTITGNTHRVGTNMVDVTCYNNSDPRVRIEPGQITVDDGTNDVVLTFSEAVSGQCTLS